MSGYAGIILLLIVSPCWSAHTSRAASSLLQRSRENAQEEARRTVPGADLIGGNLQDFKVGGITKEGAADRSHGHFLTNRELRQTSSISCLEARQKNPGISCLNGSVQPEAASNLSWSGELNAGNFPNYNDAVCRSGGEFFCDPSAVLTDEERSNVTAALGRLRESTPISCKQLNYPDKVDADSYQPFYLGVAILKDWPVQQSDADSLQRLGQIVTGEWNMENLYVGRTRPYARCPNSGMLFIFPDRGHAFLTSESCQFICSSRGGSSVASATLMVLHNQGAGAGTLAGINAVYSYLGAKTVATGTWQQNSTGTGVASSVGAGSTSSEYNPINTLQRVLFGVALGLLILSLCVGALVLWMAPGAIKELKGRRR